MRVSRLVRRNLRRNLRASLLMATGMALGLASLVFFLSLGRGVQEHVIDRVFVADQLEVVPPRVDFGGLQARGGLFGGTGLDARTVEALEALPHVRGVYPKVQVGFPAYASGGEDIVGRTFWTELIADGLPAEVVGPSLGEPDDPTLTFRDWDAPQPCDGGCAPGSACVDGLCSPQACDPLDEVWAGPDGEAARAAASRLARELGVRSSAVSVREDSAAPVELRARLAVDGASARDVARAASAVGLNGQAWEAEAPCTEAPSYCHLGSRTCRMPVPVVVSPTLLELYNGNVQSALSGSDSRMRNLPRMSESALVGLGFDGTLGRGYLGEARAVADGEVAPEQVRLRLVGFSELAIPVGVTMPLGYVQRWNERYGSERRRGSFDSLLVAVDDAAALHDVAHRIETELELALDARYEQSRRASLLVAAVTGVLALVSLLIVLLAAVGVLQSFLLNVMERKAEIGTLRALGATRGAILTIVLAEAAVVGVVAAIAGVALGLAAMAGVDQLLATQVPDFPFKPETLFAMLPTTVLAVVGGGVALCTAAAAWPAWQAARIDPAEAMRA